MSGCAFCAIAGGAEAARVFEDETTVAFLDRSPVFEGHTLLIPREHVGTLMELPRFRIEPIFLNAQRIARAVQEAMGADGVFIGINNVVSQSVPHLHVHIVPRRRGDGLRGFFWPRRKYPTPEEALRVQFAIRAAIERQGPKTE